MPEKQFISSEPAVRRPGGIVLLGMLLALLAVEASVRLWVMSRTEVIAQDGTLYLRLAKTYRVKPHQAMETFVIHPGYPAAVAATCSLFVDEEDIDNPQLWEQAGRGVAFVAGLLAIWAIWGFGAMVFRDVWIGFFGALLFGLGRKFLAVGADVLTDTMMLCFAMWGLVAALRAIKALEARRKTSLLWAVVTGLFAAAGYWVRPEGAVVIVIVVPVWVVMSIRRRFSRSLTIGVILAAVLTALLAAAPYGITNKWTLDKFSIFPSGGSFPLLARLGATDPAALKFTGQFFEAQHPILASFTCVYLLLWCIARMRRGAKLRAILPAMTPAGGGMIVTMFVFMVPLLLLWYRSNHVMSHRYLFLPAAMLSGAPVAVILCLVRLGASGVSDENKARRIRRVVWAGAILVIGIAMAVHAARPLHANHVFAKNAGVWLSERIGSRDGLLTDQAHVGYYSGTRRYRNLEDSAVRYALAKFHPGMTRKEFFRRQLDGRRPYRYVCLTKQQGPTLLREISDLLEQRGYRPIKEFPYIQDGKERPGKKSIVIFERFITRTVPAPPSGG